MRKVYLELSPQGHGEQGLTDLRRLKDGKIELFMSMDAPLGFDRIRSGIDILEIWDSPVLSFAFLKGVNANDECRT
jgi:hypothetical protein